MINIQFNKNVIAELKKHDIPADLSGTVMFVLLCMDERKEYLLDLIDDSSRQKRMLILYRFMFRRDFLVESSEKNAQYLYKISKKGLELVKILRNAFSDEVSAEDLLEPRIEDKVAIQAKEMTLSEFCERYAQLFPRTHTVNPKIAEIRFARFLKEFPEYNFNLILNAVAEYIKEFSNSETGTKYMKTAKYLIWKLENKEVTFDLATVCHQYIERNNNKIMEFNMDFLNTA